MAHATRSSHTQSNVTSTSLPAAWTYSRSELPPRCPLTAPLEVGTYIRPPLLISPRPSSITVVESVRTVRGNFLVPRCRTRACMYLSFCDSQIHVVAPMFHPLCVGETWNDSLSQETNQQKLAVANDSMGLILVPPRRNQLQHEGNSCCEDCGVERLRCGDGGAGRTCPVLKLWDTASFELGALFLILFGCAPCGRSNSDSLHCFAHASHPCHCKAWRPDPHHGAGNQDRTRPGNNLTKKCVQFRQACSVSLSCRPHCHSLNIVYIATSFTLPCFVLPYLTLPYLLHLTSPYLILPCLPPHFS